MDERSQGYLLRWSRDSCAIPSGIVLSRVYATVVLELWPQRMNVDAATVFNEFLTPHRFRSTKSWALFKRLPRFLKNGAAPSHVGASSLKGVFKAAEVISACIGLSDKVRAYRLDPADRDHFVSEIRSAFSRICGVSRKTCRANSEGLENSHTRRGVGPTA